MTTRPKRDGLRLIQALQSVNAHVHPWHVYVFGGVIHHLVHFNPLCSSCETDLCTMVSKEAEDPHMADLARDALHYGKENSARG